MLTRQHNAGCCHVNKKVAFVDAGAGQPSGEQQWDVWLRIIRTLSTELERTLGHQGASSAELQVLRLLVPASDTGMRVRDLVHELQWDRARLSHLMKRMAHRGLIQRGTCLDDARGVTVALTDAGRDLAMRAMGASTAWVQSRILSGLDEDDIAAVTRVAAKLSMAEDAADAACSPCASASADQHAQDPSERASART